MKFLQALHMRRPVAVLISLFVATGLMQMTNPQAASAAACTAPTTPLGLTTGSVAITATGTYKIVLRMMAQNTTNNSLLFEIDGSTCFTAGDSALMPTGVLTDIDYRSGNTASKMNVTLSAGTHSFKIYGREADVRLDYITFTHATVANNVKVEAESQTLSGNAQKLPNSSASGGNTVQYSIPAPADLRAVTGGNSIALQWAQVSGVKNYLVYRNGTQIATVAPSSTTYSNLYGNRYYDTTAVAGTSYNYQVRSVGTPTVVSLISPNVVAKRPTTTTVVPAVALDYSQASDLAGWMGQAKIIVQTWYPKIGDAIVGTGYAVPTSLTLRVDPTYDGVAYADANVIVMGANYIRSNPSDIGFVVHEAAHVVQSSQGNAPGLVVEGGADWARDTLFNDRNPTPPGNAEVYADGYTSGSYFLSWISSTYAKPTLVKDITVAAHNNQFSYAIFQQQTGKSVQQLWFEMTGRKTSAMEPMVGTGNQCLDVPGSNASNGQQLQLWWDCNETPAQQIIMGFNSAGTGGDLHVLGKCIEAAGSGTANGTVVQLWDCNGSSAQQWRAQSNGTLKNINANKCLDVVGDPNSGNAALQLWTCSSTKASQKWTVPDTFNSIVS